MNPQPFQNGCHLGPKCMQVGVWIWELFLKGSWHHFHRSFNITWHGRISKKPYKKQLFFFNTFAILAVGLLGWLFEWFLIDFWWFWKSKIDEKSMKNRSRRRSKTRCKLGWGLDGSWIDFWWILAPSWGASWGQVGTKIERIRVSRRHQKIIKNHVTRVDEARRGPTPPGP